VKRDGSLWAWGRDDFGLSGSADSVGRLVPTRVHGPWQAEP
jgi:hypothetical protein